MNKWKDIWNARRNHFADLDWDNSQQVFMELKRIDGFDVEHGGIPYVSLLQQYQECKKRLTLMPGDSVFEVGCGCGANLYLFHTDGIQIGGIDYSECLIDMMKQVFRPADFLECMCNEAIYMPTDRSYDAVLADSVFSYFIDLKYAAQVLKKMLLKTRYAIGILDIHDIEKKDAFISYRKRHIDRYEERYEGLPKLFYPQSFFRDFAKDNALEVEFVPAKMEGYWNTPFVYHCFLYNSRLNR